MTSWQGIGAFAGCPPWLSITPLLACMVQAFLDYLEERGINAELGMCLPFPNHIYTCKYPPFLTRAHSQQALCIAPPLSAAHTRTSPLSLASAPVLCKHKPFQSSPLISDSLHHHQHVLNCVHQANTSGFCTSTRKPLNTRHG